MRARQTVVTFFIALLVLLGLSHWLGQQIPGSRDAEFLHRTRLLEQVWRAQEPFSVILGSSRSAWGIDPTALKRPGFTFNFAEPGAGIDRQFFTLQRLIRLGRTPRMVLAEAWWVNFCSAASQSHWLSLLSSGERDLYYRWAQEKDNGAAVFEDLDWPVRYALAEWIPEFHRQDRNLDAYGFGRVPEGALSAADGRQRRFEENVREHAALLHHLNKPPLPRAAMRALLELCQQRKIEVVLVVNPDSPAYRARLGPEPWKRCLPIWRQWAAEYGARIVDGSQWGKDTDFADGVHLSAVSVQLYTAWLGQQLE